MAGKLCLVMVLLICSDYAHKGAKGDVTPTVFSSAGGQVSLPCTNKLHPGCSSTTWIYNNASELGTIEEVGHGIVKQSSQTNRSQRLRVAPDCSLTLTNVTVEDAGLYTCQQFPTEGGQQQGDNAPVYLAILHVSVSSEATEIKTGSDVGLHCLLHTHDKCGNTVENKGVTLSWVDEGGMKLHESPNRRIRTSSVCNMTILEKLIDPDLSQKKRSWTCQLTANRTVQASVKHTIPIKALESSFKTTTDSTATLSLIPAGNTVSMTVGALVVIVLFATVLILVIYKRRPNSERGAQGNVDVSTMYATVSESNPPPFNEQGTKTEDLHYASFDQLNRTSTNHSIKPPRDMVTYSTVMLPSSDDHSVLYATVQDAVST